MIPKIIFTGSSFFNSYLHILSPLSLSLPVTGVAVVQHKQRCVVSSLLLPNKDRKLTIPSPTPPPCFYLPISLHTLLLISVLTHHPHLSKKSFKLLEVESRAGVGGTAAGSLPQPEHCVQHLGDGDTVYAINSGEKQLQLTQEKMRKE